MDLLAGLKQESVVKMNLSDYCTAEASASVKDVLADMNAQSCHNALILRGGKLAGIFTDRDVLMKIADNPETLDQPVSKFMTAEVVTVSKAATAADALALMSVKHIRNIPIVEDDGSVVGNFTHFSVLDFLAEKFPDVSLTHFPNYSRRFSRRRHGG
jgi:CBS domain-containing protein